MYIIFVNLHAHASCSDKAEVPSQPWVDNPVCRRMHLALPAKQIIDIADLKQVLLHHPVLQ